MTLVEREESPGAEPLRNDDHAQICQPNVEVFVVTLQISHNSMIVRIETRDREPPSRQVVKERHFER